MASKWCLGRVKNRPFILTLPRQITVVTEAALDFLIVLHFDMQGRKKSPHRSLSGTLILFYNKMQLFFICPFLFILF